MTRNILRNITNIEICFVLTVTVAVVTRIMRMQSGIPIQRHNSCYYYYLLSPYSSITGRHHHYYLVVWPIET